MNNTLSLINIEKAVLSSFLFGDDLAEVKEYLKSEDFYLPAHQKIYSAMLELFDKDIPIDEEFLRKKLNTKDVDDSVLFEILSANPISNTKAYVKEIKDSSLKRKLASLATTIKKVCIEEDTSADEALNQIEDSFYGIADTTTQTTASLEQIVENFHTKFKQSYDGVKNGITTGIKQLDNVLGLLEYGEMVAVGARPSMGKSSFAFQIASHNIDKNKGVIVDSLEMPAEDVILRILAHKNQESISDLRKGVVKDFEKFNESLSYLKYNQNLVIHDRVKTFAQLKSSFLREKRRRDKLGLDTSLWIIDHLGYTKTDSRFKREELTAGTKMLKQIAKEHNVVVMPLSQLNRDLKGRKSFRPMLSDFKDTGSLEEDCDKAIFPHRDSYYEKANKNEIEPPVNPANLLILKNRNGATGVVNLDFNGPTNSFGNYPSITIYPENGNVEIPPIMM
ncbi:DnaB-like helicase C-terminal domain-containing protein [Halarcobacter sp.]|uniref:DnaB-like helicase C-terminal domain-containing protein n=1 Tax=Halarcobacter sp. TaxID=2321133 RepID=UPI003A8E2558